MSARHLSVLVQKLRRLVAKPSDGEADSVLLARFVKERDEQAFGLLMRRYGPMVMSACRRVAGHQQDAEDVFQATFLLLAHKAATIRNSAAVGSWLFGVAYRLALRVKARAARRRQHEALAAGPEACEHSDGLSWSELRSIVDEELARLPDKFRAPVLLCCCEGLTQEEAGNQLGWTKRSVKDRLERGRNRLRARLTARGLTLSAAWAGPMLVPGASSAAVPIALAHSTLRAVGLIALGESITAAVSINAAALAKGGLKAMLISKLVVVTAGVVLMAGISGAGLALSWPTTAVGPEGLRARAKPPSPSADLQALQPNKSNPVDLFGDPLPVGAVARLGTQRFRMSGDGPATGGIGFLAGAKTIVSASGNSGNAVFYWEATTGKLLREIKIGNFGIQTFAVSPNGKYFAAGSPSGIAVWDAAAAKEVRTFERPAREVDYRTHLVFTSDGKLLVSLSADGTLRIEEVVTGVEHRSYQFNRDFGAALAVSSDGSMIAVASGPNPKKLFVWKWQSTENPREVAELGRGSRVLAFSSDGKMIAECGILELFGNPVSIWDVASGRVVKELAPPGPSASHYDAVVFTPDGKSLIISRHNVPNKMRVVHCWDTATWTYSGGMETGEAGLLAVSADSKLLAGTTANVVHVWDMASKKELGVSAEAQQGSIRHVAVHGNLAVTSGDRSFIGIWDWTSGKQLLQIPRNLTMIRALAISPDGSTLVTSTADDSVCLWALAAGKMIHKLPGHGRLGGIRGAGCFTPDGKHMLSCGDDMILRKWEVATGKTILELAIQPQGMDLSNRDAATNPVLRRALMDGHDVFSPDGNSLLMSFGNAIHVFDAATGKDLYQMSHEGGHLSSLAMSSDNKMLLTSADSKPAQNQEICLWELSTRQLRKQINLPNAKPGPVAFSPDNKFFAAAASGEPDGRIGVWDTASAKEVTAFKGFRGSVRSLVFTDDGTRLISGMSDTTALVWDLKQKP